MKAVLSQYWRNALSEALVDFQGEVQCLEEVLAVRVQFFCVLFLSFPLWQALQETPAAALQANEVRRRQANPRARFSMSSWGWDARY